jgi:hypothetical protein
LEIESFTFIDPIFKNKKVTPFTDSSPAAELERKGYFAQLQLRRKVKRRESK